jgi:hypothetical protein
MFRPRLADMRVRQGVQMIVRHIDQVFWYKRRNCMVVTYRDGDPDRIPATERSAAVLSEQAGLVLVPTLPGVVRWVRHPESVQAA